MTTYPVSRPAACRLRALAALSSLGVAIALTGCSGFTSTAASSSPAAGVPFGGFVHGGQQPVSGSHIYLFGGGTTGYSSSATSLLTATTGTNVDQYGRNYVTSDGNGNFSFTGYTCPSANTPTYLLALGGNPGLSGTVNNIGISEIAAVGACGSISTSTFINVSEVTTAAFVTALQQYMVGPTSVGAPTTNQTGLRIAFALAQDLANSATGRARSTNVNGNGTVPAAKLNTLGNIIAPCINSAQNNSSACASLFSAINPSGSNTTPSETVSSLINIAKNPGYNVAGLFSQSNAAAPFQPSLSSAPNDFTVAITYSGGGLTAPGYIAIDANGDAFVGNTPSGSIGSIVGFSPNGVVLTGTTGYNQNIHMPQAIAFDVAGNIWSANPAFGNQPDQIVKLTSAGNVVFAFNDGSLGGVAGLALDGNQNAWAANVNNNSLIKINASGVKTATVTSAGFATPAGIGIDGSSNVYAAGAGSNSVLKFTSAGVVTSPAAGYTANYSVPLGISIDNSANVYTINNNTSLITEINGNTGAQVANASPTPSLSNANVIAIDGLGGGWIANCRVSCGGTTAKDNLVHIVAGAAQSTGSADGYQDTNLSRPGVAAVDNIGNVWVSNNAAGTVTEFIGIAPPVVTPIAAGILNNTIGTRP